MAASFTGCQCSTYGQMEGSGAEPFWLWWAMEGSNLRPSGCKPDALAAELIARLLEGDGRGSWGCAQYVLEVVGCGGEVLEGVLEGLDGGFEG